MTVRITSSTGQRLVFTFNDADRPARVAQSRVLALAFERGFRDAVNDARTGRRTPCPYAKAYAAEIWDLGYRYALKGKRDEC